MIQFYTETHPAARPKCCLSQLCDLLFKKMPREIWFYAGWRRLSIFLFSKPYDVAWCLFFWASWPGSCPNSGELFELGYEPEETPISPWKIWKGAKKKPPTLKVDCWVYHITVFMVLPICSINVLQCWGSYSKHGGGLHRTGKMWDFLCWSIGETKTHRQTMFDLWFGIPIDPIATFPDFAERINIFDGSLRVHSPYFVVFHPPYFVGWIPIFAGGNPRVSLSTANICIAAQPLILLRFSMPL